MKTILEIIKVLSLASIPILIIYFRKELKSLLNALSEAEFIKWGKRGEYKRLKAINKVVKDIDIVASKSVSFSGNIAASSSVTGSLSSEPKLLSVRIQQLEEENAKLKQLLLGMSAIAVGTLRTTLTPELEEFIKKIGEQQYKEVLAINPKSEILVGASVLLDLTRKGDRIGVGEDIKVEVVKPDDVNAPDEIPPEESQESKP